ncbi:hypothetical protein SAMN04487949_0354 [Halogranum gelatinilyticum]|uniref:HVO-0234-like beta-propeller domain-containing protein n=1 Tax=Halogranum gelatinilyticum TaxID=660521 RepID=A0A1G9PEC4_9EURY|nr:hypothetical protein [Halogranum gelatinilyticum]SDL97166.1 hypothetical protein SAMN04487949_0354 [Halogranum gelatinilyticum]
MPNDDTIEEKRVYSDKAGKVEVFVASELGVVAVDVSGDRVGEFGLAHRCTARAIAAEGERVAVATDEDVDLAVGDEEFEPTGFGPAVAVGFHDGDLLAANEDGWVARYDPERADEVDLTDLDAADADAAEKLAWQTLGHVETVRAIDGPLVAAADGVYRVGDGDLSHAGLDDVRDVAGRGVPLAATGESLYTLGNGWMDVLDGVFRSVSGDGFERAHAIAGTTVYAKVDDEWQEADLPTDDPVVDVAYAPGAVFAVTEAGTLLVDAGDGWQTQVLGVRGVAGLAVR